jgi:hypothetical protein
MVAMSLLLIHPYAASAGWASFLAHEAVDRTGAAADRAAGEAAGRTAGRAAGEAQSGADSEVGRQLGEKPGRATGKCVVEALQDSGGRCNDPRNDPQ